LQQFHEEEKKRIEQEILRQRDEMMHAIEEQHKLKLEAERANFEIQRKEFLRESAHFAS